MPTKIQGTVDAHWMAAQKGVACNGHFTARAYAGEIETRGKIAAKICAKRPLKCAKNKPVSNSMC